MLKEEDVETDNSRIVIGSEQKEKKGGGGGGGVYVSSPLAALPILTRFNIMMDGAGRERDDVMDVGCR